MTTPHLPVTIIGAGLSGIALAARLREAGIQDFTILEKSEGVGGVWRQNTYPGCACDVPSVLYSLSFAPNPDWSRLYAPQPEILAYAERVAREHDVARHTRFGCAVEDARWDDEGRLWRLETTDGPMTADVLIAATGPSGEPVVPEIPGRERFAGTTFHSLHWDHGHDLRGERVAVVGTGPSAAQFIPEIQPAVGKLVVFQRTPAWIMPRVDGPTSALRRALYRRIPGVMSAGRAFTYSCTEGLGLVVFVDRRWRHGFEAIGRWQLRRQVPDRVLRARLTPDYVIGCKRAILTDDYLPSLSQPNVAVVTDTIEGITERGVMTADGTEHVVDTIIWGTGFDAPSRRGSIIRGRDGRSLVDVYDDRPRSYLGTALNGFPNLFTIIGPYAAAGNQSALYAIECQVRYVVDALRTMRRDGVRVIEVRADAQERFVEEMERRSRTTIWETGGCRSSYQRPDGRNSGLWPSWSFAYRWRTRRFDSDAYTLEAAA